MYQRLNNVDAFGPFQHPLGAPQTKPRQSASARKATPDLRAICADTPVPTPTGPVAAGDLRVGDHVTASDGAALRITRLTRSTFSQNDLALNRDLAPIRIEGNACTGLTNTTTLLVSPDLALHPMQGSAETLPARALYDGCMIRAVTPENGIDYIHIALDRPASLDLDGLSIRLGEPAGQAAAGQASLGWQHTEKRVFRPIR
ncbi:Hint domain-containing protein [Gymnodinialimonas ulvae]|uniref:Hint domain-containing protein n=1 Tax=Gymnodinialimonas ulvae TaxID=3126504 RepID=UPI0030AAB82B